MFFIFLIITPYLGVYLISLTIQMANQRGFFLFNHHPLLGCLLDWSYNPNGQSKRFFLFNLGLDLPLMTSSPIFIHISGLTSNCQLFKFSFFHLDLPLIASFSFFSYLDLPPSASLVVL